jgi:hypothetical protein
LLRIFDNNAGKVKIYLLALPGFQDQLARFFGITAKSILKEEFESGC